MITPLIQLSQSHLRLLTLCPRKYQYNFLDQFFIPTTKSQTYVQEELGKRFHLVMQQHWMDLDIEPILKDSPEIQQRFEAFKQHPPNLIAEKNSKDAQHLTEHRRRIKFEDYLLVGIFDLLILTPDSGQIVDWKSYIKPRNTKPIQKSWQTKLYPFLLAETSQLSPEQISMTYWFAQTHEPNDSHTITFNYSTAQHQKIKQTLHKQLKKLTGWMQAYQQSDKTNRKDFPQVKESAGICDPAQNPCLYRYRCQRSQTSSSQTDWDKLLDLDAIPPFSLETDRKSEPR